MGNVHTFGDSHDVRLLITPAAQGDTDSSWIAPFADGGGANMATFWLVLGTITQNVDFKLEQSTTAAGAGPVKDITGAVSATHTTSTDNTIVEIEIAPGALDDKNGYKFVRAVVNFASATDHVWCLILIKHRLRNPGTFTHHATYSEHVVVI